MIVRFSDPSEFLSELERDPQVVARKLVRVTTLRRPALQGAITTVLVVATAKVASGSDYDILRLERYLGDLWGIEHADSDVRARADDACKELEHNLAQGGFVCAFGVYEPEQGHAGHETG